MNYYIIPKNSFNIKINLLINSEQITPFISYSLIHFLNEIYSQLLNIENDNMGETTLEFINKIVNPFEFIHTNVPGSLLSVSKVKPSSNIFFELMEVLQVCNIVEMLSFKKQIHISHITRNHSSTNYLMDMLRETNIDIISNYNFDYESLCEKFIAPPEININNNNNNNKINKSDLFIFEFDETDYMNTDKYIKNMILVLYIVAKYQESNGICIIKMDNIFYKTIVDILFIFSAIYERVLIIKPSISKITKGERYLICKNLNMDILNNSRLLEQLDEYVKPNLNNKSINNINVQSLIKNDIPYYFSNKIEEANAVIGQQQLEAFDQILNIFKNKNRNEKIEILKRNHIQKCIQWCEKNQLPHNKFIDKLNMFLNVKKNELGLEKDALERDKDELDKDELDKDELDKDELDKDELDKDENMLYNNLLDEIDETNKLI